MYIVKCVSIRLTFVSQGLFPIVNPLLTNNTNITDIFIGIKRKQVIIPKYYKSDKSISRGFHNMLLDRRDIASHQINSSDLPFFNYLFVLLLWSPNQITIYQHRNMTIILSNLIESICITWFVRFFNNCLLAYLANDIFSTRRRSRHKED